MSTLEKRRLRSDLIVLYSFLQRGGYVQREVLFDTKFTEIHSTETAEAQGKISANELESDNTPDAFVWIAKYWVSAITHDVIC